MAKRVARPRTDPDWKKLRHAYGSADDLPELLEQLDPDLKSPVWQELWSRVCHQYSTYSASPYVLPYLLAAAREWKPKDRVMPLCLAGGIVAAPETNLKKFSSIVEELEKLARDTLKTARLDPSARVHLVQAMRAFAGDRFWGDVLDRVNDGEISAKCPACRKDLYVVLGDAAYCCLEDWVRAKGARQSAVTARAPKSLTGTGRELYSHLSVPGGRKVASSICQLFGTTTCPNCSREIEVSEAVAAFERR